MKKIAIPIMIQDPNIGTGDPVEGYNPIRDFFLDGPVTKQVAVLGFDPDTGTFKTGAKYKHRRDRALGWYENAEGEDLYKLKKKAMYQPEFMQVSVFAAVLKTIDMFENWETLGRELKWAFDGPQLLVIPCAGEMQNAFYHRDTHSLQFFHFLLEEKKKMIYTCLSRDIVAHETGHAIVDGIAPDLLDAATPQSLAIHETIADLTALLMAVNSHTLRKRILADGKGSIKPEKGPNPFAEIAEEFGGALGHTHGLRTLLNKKNLNPKDEKNYVGNSGPHDLSQALSGALFDLLYEIHESLKEKYVKKGKYAGSKNPYFTVSGYALHKASKRFKRMVFRALDYLPPGEVSFIDYGRALFAVDRIAFPGDSRMRDWLRKSFVDRFIIRDKSTLEEEDDLVYTHLEEMDMDSFQKSDWKAYDFANKNRRFLGIPPEVVFEVRPRLVAEKKYDWDLTGKECIFKVSWEEIEKNPLGKRYPRERKITVGTTLVIDWKTRRILTRLTNAPPRRDMGRYSLSEEERRINEYKEQRSSRDSFLTELVQKGILLIGQNSLKPDGKPLQSIVRAEVSRGVMSFKRTANMLYLTEAYHG